MVCLSEKIRNHKATCFNVKKLRVDTPLYTEKLITKFGRFTVGWKKREMRGTLTAIGRGPGEEDALLGKSGQEP